MKPSERIAEILESTEPYTVSTNEGKFELKRTAGERIEAILAYLDELHEQGVLQGKSEQ